MVENIYCREVSEEHRRRCREAAGKAWSLGVIPEIFLDKVLGEDQNHSAMLSPQACILSSCAIAAPCMLSLHMLWVSALPQSTRGSCVLCNKSRKAVCRSNDRTVWHTQIICLMTSFPGIAYIGWGGVRNMAVRLLSLLAQLTPCGIRWWIKSRTGCRCRPTIRSSG